MRPRMLIAAALAAVLAVPAVAAPAHDWSHTVSRTADGAFVEGNPRARVALVEYLSFTCPHCALMEAQAIPPLTARYIRTGQVRYEVRHALRDSYDLIAALLARCDGPGAFFKVAPAVYAAQPQWMEKAAAYGATAPTTLPVDKGIVAAAEGSGLSALFAAHGLPAARANACLTDAGERKRLSDMAEAAWKMPGFPGTPDWVLNGKQLDGVDDWPKLDAAIAAALKH